MSIGDGEAERGNFNHHKNRNKYATKYSKTALLIIANNSPESSCLLKSVGRHTIQKWLGIEFRECECGEWLGNLFPRAQLVARV